MIQADRQPQGYQCKSQDLVDPELEKYAQDQADNYALMVLAAWIEKLQAGKLGFWKLGHPSVGDAFVLGEKASMSFVLGTTDEGAPFVGADQDFAPFWADLPWEAVRTYKGHLAFTLTTDGTGFSVVVPCSTMVLKALAYTTSAKILVSTIEAIWNERGARSFDRKKSNPVSLIRL